MSTCRNGHDIDVPNPWIFRKDGSRRCRQCKRAGEKRHDALHPGRRQRYTKRLRAYYAAYMHTVRGGPERADREPWTPAEIETLLRRWDEGVTAPEISEEIGRTPSTIYLRLRILRLSGVPVPTRSVLAKTYPVKGEEMEPVEPEPIRREPVAVAPLAPRGFAVYASGIRDSWDEDQPIHACRPVSGR